VPTASCSKATSPFNIAVRRLANYDRHHSRPSISSTVTLRFVYWGHSEITEPGVPVLYGFVSIRGITFPITVIRFLNQLLIPLAGQVQYLFPCAVQPCVSSEVKRLVLLVVLSYMQ